MNKKRYYSLLFLLFTWVSNSFGQTYGNEWIQYNQSYFSFKVAPGTVIPTSFNDQSGTESGVYMIEYSTLVNSGVPVNSFSSDNIQIFGKEKEIPLYINDGGDNSFDSGDYILFYTERNDGWMDSSIYESSNAIGNPYYSVANDTLEYFFTWNNATNNLRFVEEDNVNYASFTPSEYILYTKWYSYHIQYQEGKRNSESSSSFYTIGEGWSSSKVNGVNSYNWALGNTTILYPFQGMGAPDVTFKAMTVGVSNASYSSLGNHHCQWSIGATDYILSDSIWIGYTGLNLTKQFPVSILPSSGNSNLKAKILGDQGAATDYQSISHWSFKYPRKVQFNGESKVEFNVVNNLTESKIRLDITNISYNNPIVFVFGDTPKRVKVSPNGAFFTTLISNSSNGNEQHVVYQDSSTITAVSSLSPVNGNGIFTDFGAISNKEYALLMITHPKLKTISDEYVAYRQSFAGGNYNVIDANVIELYQQFGGGIESHINGIRRFSHFIYNNSIKKPVGLFLVGKGIKKATVGNLTGTRTNPTYFTESLIPAFGEPPSDICITSNLVGIKKWSPLIPTGRISARSNAELSDYLDKVKLFDQNQDSTSVYNTLNKDWQKQILHFVGGSNTSQQNQFQFYMNSMRDIIADSLFGANTTSIYKTNSNPLDPTILTDITDRISEGVSLMTYFGHASGNNSGFEINLDEPGSWNNLGRYPIMLVNACYNGNIYQYSNSYSEIFVQEPLYGAIGYIASVNVGYDLYLNLYSNRLYQQFSRYNYGATVAEAMKKNIETIELPSNIDNLALETTCTQMVFNGDPMLRLNHHNKPEIELLEENVWFTPENPDLTVDSMEIHINLKNLGRSVTDSFSIEIIRNFPSNEIDSVYHFRLSKLNYQSEFTFKVPLQPNISLGLNTFNISVDLPSEIGEVYDEINNNQITKTLFLDIDGIIPVIPYRFAVVPDDSVTVKASTNNPIADFNTYRFEIDTIDFVGVPSLAHRYAIVSGFGGVKEVNPSEWTLTSSPSSNGTLVCEDSIVYFWRVSIVGDTTWKESSFQYINGRSGWGQDHFFQFKNNSFSSVDYNRSLRLKEFSPKISELSCTVTHLIPAYDSQFSLNLIQQDYGMCTTSPTLHVAVIDPVTHEAWGTKFTDGNGITHNPTHDFGNANNESACRNRIEKFFLFREGDPTQLAAFQNMVNNEVPDGHYLLIYSPVYTYYSYWDALDSVNMYATFSNLGSDSIVPGRANLPFAFFVRKGDASTVVENVSQFVGDDFTITANLVGPLNAGAEISPLIGPTVSWGSLHWKQDPLEVSSHDSTVLSVKRYNQSGVFQNQIDTVFSSNDSIINLNTLIDASQYPFIRLEAHYSDTTTLTPAQIDRWHVLYTPVPEAAIDGSSGYTWTALGDSVLEGAPIYFAVDVKNIFSVDMDSLLINYWIEDANHVLHPISYSRQDSLLVNETFRDTVLIPTLGLGGPNILWMEINPYINGSTVVTDQPEQEHFNNILQFPFSVQPDDENPLLDVTFNGNHILNGDIVDPNSEIYITLKDDNDFLIMDNISDTSNFGIYLTNPAGSQIRIPFIDQTGAIIMQWTPANAQNKRFKIVWPAAFEMDGTYSLFVQGTDRSGNVSGDIEYRVRFEIVHESTITNMMNYPNPFSTSTRFVFTLTGSEVPDDIMIQIMTISGRVVRTITEDELGLIEIGRNITEFAWDGTDEFGDPLANGVYLYRVKAKLNGEYIKHRESGADQHFEKNFGKMYILR